MATSVLMEYKIGFVDIDRAYDVMSQLRSARDHVASRYQTIDCKVDFIPRESRTELRVRIEAQQPALLEQAVKDYVKIAGSPDFVQSGSDYALMDRVLREIGKMLKRKYGGALVGKHVVPLVAHQ